VRPERALRPGGRYWSGLDMVNILLDHGGGVWRRCGKGGRWPSEVVK